MASLFQQSKKNNLSLLDGRRGTRRFIHRSGEALVYRKGKPKTIRITAVRIEIPHCLTSLSANLKACQKEAQGLGVSIKSEIRIEDFIEAAHYSSGTVGIGLPSTASTAAILNPPYGKLRSASPKKAQLACRN